MALGLPFTYTRIIFVFYISNKHRVCKYIIRYLKPGSQRDARLSFCFVSIFHHSVSFCCAVHNVASICAFLNFHPWWAEGVGSKKQSAHT